MQILDSRHKNESRRQKNEASDMFAKGRFRLDCAFAQSDQNLHLVHFG